MSLSALPLARDPFEHWVVECLYSGVSRDDMRVMIDRQLVDKVRGWDGNPKTLVRIADNFARCLNTQHLPDARGGASLTGPPLGKHLSRAFYSVELRPNTDANAVLGEFQRRLGDPAGRMRVLSIWSRVDHTAVGATVAYEARGANANDVWRRVCGITPLVRSQVTVTELATFNLEVDAGTRPGVPW